MSEYGGQQPSWQQQQAPQQYGMHPQGQSPQMMQNPRAPSPVMMQMQMQSPNQGQLMSSSPNMQMQQPQQMIISQPQPMSTHIQGMSMTNGQPGTIVMTNQSQMQHQPRPQGIKPVQYRSMPLLSSRTIRVIRPPNKPYQGMVPMQMQPPQHQLIRHGPPMSNQPPQLIQSQQHAPYGQPSQPAQYIQPGQQSQFVGMQSRPSGMPYGNHPMQPPQQAPQNGMSSPNLGMRSMGPPGGPGPHVVRAIQPPVQVRVFSGDPMPMQPTQERPQMYQPSALRQALNHGPSMNPPQVLGTSPISHINSSSDSMETSPQSAGSALSIAPPVKPAPPPRQGTPVAPKKTPTKTAAKSGVAKGGAKAQPAVTVMKSLHTPMPNARMGALIDRQKLESLMSTVDKNETLEDDVAEALLQYVEEYVGNIISSASRLAKHRHATKLEAKDVKYVLQREFNVALPNDTNAHGPPKRPAVNVHQQRMALIEKALKKP